MTVNTTNITAGPYTGNGLSDEYSYGFTVEDKTQLSVYETTDAGVQTLLVVDTDYTVNDVGTDGGGTITRLAGNLPTSYLWYIRSNRTENQLTDFSSQGAFFPEIHEDQMDHITFLIQQLRDSLDRQIGYSETTDVSGIDLTFPAPVADSVAAVWNGAGTALEIGPTVDEIANAEAAAIAAVSAYDSFDDRYLGEKSSPPTLDNDGNALLNGAMYWNNTTVPGKMWIYDIGAVAWGLITSANATSASSVSISDVGGYYTGSDVEAMGQEVGVEFAALPTKVETLSNKTLSNPAITAPTVNGVSGYGMVILDEPKLLATITTSVAVWTNLDMSTLYPAAATAGAKIALLKIVASLDSTTAGITTSAVTYLKETGGGGSITTHRVSQLQVTKDTADTSPSASEVAQVSEATIPLDANSDLSYQSTLTGSGAAKNIEIFLVGYYV